VVLLFIIEIVFGQKPFMANLRKKKILYGLLNLIFNFIQKKSYPKKDSFQYKKAIPKKIAFNIKKFVAY
jgi:hypothetical protein